MARNIKEIINALPAARRRKIAKRAADVLKGAVVGRLVLEETGDGALTPRAVRAACAVDGWTVAVWARREVSDRQALAVRSGDVGQSVSALVVARSPSTLRTGTARLAGSASAGRRDAAATALAGRVHNSCSFSSSAAESRDEASRMLAPAVATGGRALLAGLRRLPGPLWSN